ncbi:YciI family protein [Cellulomonas sp. Marseille-Q8402]
MTRYLISFDEGAMAHLSAQELAAAGDVSHRVVADAKEAGVWVHGGGVVSAAASVVGPDGSVTTAAYPEPKAVVGGFSIIDVATRDEALRWAARIADACRCPQEVRALMDDPEA